MTYASLGGIGPWYQCDAETDEVYIWRAKMKAPIVTAEDMQEIARATGSVPRWSLDLRGVTAHEIAPELFRVDAVYTSPVYTPNPGGCPPFIGPVTMYDGAGSIAKRVAEALKGRFPEIKISDAKLLVIDDNKPQHVALDFWLQQPIIYQGSLTGKGKPLAAFGEMKGLFQGVADQGIMLKEWPKPDPGKEDPAKKSGAKDYTLLMLLGGGAAIWYFFIRPQSA